MAWIFATLQVHILTAGAVFQKPVSLYQQLIYLVIVKTTKDSKCLCYIIYHSDKTLAFFFYCLQHSSKTTTLIWKNNEGECIFYILKRANYPTLTIDNQTLLTRVGIIKRNNIINITYVTSLFLSFFHTRYLSGSRGIFSNG